MRPEPFSFSSMTPKLLPCLATLSSVLFVSCYPLPEERQVRPQRPADESVTTQNQQTIQEQRERMKERAEQKPNDIGNNPRPETPRDTTTSNTAPKPAEPKRTDYSFANPVPGKEGFVFSPYNNKVVDVRDIPSGTLVQDPTYPASEKKYFRVP